MKISPATEQKKPNYPALLAAAAVVATTTLASCQQQQIQQGAPMPEQRPFTLGGVK
ncbi:MAG: hypothetical protein J1E42_01095 [Akkermansiaceae bacterium]|nr:hypothetical protein [Akkermansiaceae bacterium]